MTIITAPNSFIRAIQDHLPNPVLFLAGGISGCANWQRQMLADLDVCKHLLVLNPRRANWGTDFSSDEQVEWEYSGLHAACAISFWFPAESICPIALFELGSQSQNDKPLFVGCHPSYQRVWDIRKQLSLVRPDVNVCMSLPDLSKQVCNWYEKKVQFV